MVKDKSAIRIRINKPLTSSLPQRHDQIYLKRAHGHTRQAHGEADDEERLFEEAADAGRSAEVAQCAEGGHSQRRQHQQTGLPSGRLHHRGTEVNQEDERCAQGKKQGHTQVYEQGCSERSAPRQVQLCPLLTCLALCFRPVIFVTRLAASITYEDT